MSPAQLFLLAWLGFVWFAMAMVVTLVGRERPPITGGSVLVSLLYVLIVTAGVMFLVWPEL